MIDLELGGRVPEKIRGLFASPPKQQVVDQQIEQDNQQENPALLLEPTENIIFLRYAVDGDTHILTRTFDQPLAEQRKSPRPVRIVGTE